MDRSSYSRWMRSCIRLSRRALGLASPNPAVAALVVREDEEGAFVVGQAVTALGGRPHAEMLALQMAGNQAQGATLFVSLEPCFHEGRGPACADLILASAVRKVVIGCLDPDLRTASKSVDKLLEQGLEVEPSVEAKLAREAMAAHFVQQIWDRPKVTMKLALSVDGKIAGPGGAAVPITGEDANRFSHGLRAEVDAIIVGAGTWRRDKPALTCRLPGLADRSPQVVVLSRSGELGGWRGGDEREIWLASPHARPEPPFTALPMTGESESEQILDLLKTLGKRGIRHVLVEGGPEVWEAFLHAGAVDELWCWEAPDVILEEEALGLVKDGALKKVLLGGSDFVHLHQEWVGKDRLSIWRSRALSVLLKKGK